MNMIPTELALDIEALAFVTGVYLGSTEGRYPMTDEEAEYTINAWKEEGIEIPKNLTPSFYANVWNDLLKGDN